MESPPPINCSNKVGGLGGGSFPPPVLPRSLRASAMGSPAFLVLSWSNVQVDLFLRDDWDGTSSMSPGQLAIYQQLQRRRAPGAAAPSAAWVLHNEGMRSGECSH